MKPSKQDWEASQSNFIQNEAPKPFQSHFIQKEPPKPFHTKRGAKAISYKMRHQSHFIQKEAPKPFHTKRGTKAISYKKRASYTTAEVKPLPTYFSFTENYLT